MIVPEKLAKFMQGPIWGHAGTRNRDLVPATHMIGGFCVSADRKRVTILVPDHATNALRENLADNGQIAITFGEQVSHESYQLKGRSVEVRPIDASDAPVRGAYLGVMAASLAEAGMPPEVGAAFEQAISRSGLAVTFEVDDIFVQTPGPGAGERLAAGAT